jgi:hypothetical protein
MKRPLADGRQEMQLEPVELLRRLATLVPPPRAHVVRFHGIGDGELIGGSERDRRRGQDEAGKGMHRDTEEMMCRPE